VVAGWGWAVVPRVRERGWRLGVGLMVREREGVRGRGWGRGRGRLAWGTGRVMGLGAWGRDLV
jgi:hypothetical protein